MLKLTPEDISAFARMVLAEDHADNDVTSLAVVSPEATARGVFEAREPMVLAGMALAEAIVHTVDPSVIVTPHARDGDRLDKGERIATLGGPARAILTAERGALNTLQHLSGIATHTRRYVDAIEGTGAILLDTRKTIPGLRRMGKYATSVGGAENQRMTLSDAILINDNHNAIRGGVTAAVEAARAGSSLPIEVECDTLEQVQEALVCGVTHILLDNMSPFELRRAVAIASGQAKLEASGGVTLETIRRIAETGVDYISVGRLTQSAPAVDIGLDFQHD
jgi:nicotinate-nucleotide pyrophosphorylase (carboxylating)